MPEKTTIKIETQRRPGRPRDMRYDAEVVEGPDWSRGVAASESTHAGAFNELRGDMHFAARDNGVDPADLEIIHLPYGD